MFSPLKHRLLFAIAFCAALAAPDRAAAYVFNGYSWPRGSNIVLNLRLSGPPANFSDGSTSWNASAADALRIWNQYMDVTKFVQGSGASDVGGDGANSVFFSDSIYGYSFGPNVIAFTTYYSTQGSTFTETDVIFNTAVKWASYRGPLRKQGNVYTYDLHRTALHEFGHVLGLDHPDQRGQPGIVAIMNSITSNLDQLAEDDIDGARALYGFRITSAQSTQYTTSGSPFSYQITADNTPTNYGASGLPPGIQVDYSSGLISGRCTTSGTFTIQITAQGPRGIVSGSFQLAVYSLPLTSSPYPPQVLIGDSFTYQITAGNSPTSFTATGLPAGLSLDPGTGIISGTPSGTGNFAVQVTASSSTSVAAGTIIIQVSPPRITSSTNPAPVELGDPFTYQIAATHSPTGFSASNLPQGLSVNPSTGVISGTVSTAGSFYITVSANTAYGRATANVYLSVLSPRLTSPLYLNSYNIGNEFSYQIIASNRPYLFTADALPSGLQLDANTGRISGVLTLSGSVQIQLTARGKTGDATGTLTFRVLPLEVPSAPAAVLPLLVTSATVADPLRPRLYAVSGSNLLVIDTVSLRMLESIPFSSTLYDLAVSADRNKLWITLFDGGVIKCLDLNTLAVLPEVVTGKAARQIEEGSGGRIYANYSNAGGAMQIDLSTGSTLAEVGANPPGYYNFHSFVALSPDGNNLFLTELSPDPVLTKYNVTGGVSPVLSQRVSTPGTNFGSAKLVVSPNGQSLARLAYLNGNTEPTKLYSTADLNVVQGTLPSNATATDACFSPDGALIFQTYYNQSAIEVFDTASRTRVRTIRLPDGVTSNLGTELRTSLAVDSSNTYLFVIGTGSRLYVYPLKSSPAAVPAHSLLNVSTRLPSQQGDKVLIGGFIITGSEPKDVALRAIGPSLPLSGTLGDPVLELHGPDGALLSYNDNWSARRADVLKSGLPPTDEHESVIIATLAPGAYTAILSGLGGSTGVGLVELYDLTPAINSRIANISTRGKVETGDNVMIGGFIVGGDQPTKVIVRAIGPSLASQGVSGALADTVLELYDANANIVASNDDWQSDQSAEIDASNVPPNDPRESAIVRTLAPGSYTAIVRGKNNTSGIGLVEVYNLEPN